MLSAAQVGEKWSRSMAGASENYKQGVMAVNESPTEKAAQAADRYVMGVQQSVDSGRFQARLRRITLQDWKSAAINKGAGRLATGAAQAKEKYTQSMGNLLPYIAQGVAQLPARGTLEQNLQRMMQMATYMAQYKGAA